MLLCHSWRRPYLASLSSQVNQIRNGFLKPSRTAAMSSVLRDRIKHPHFLDKVKKAEDVIDLFPNGASIGWSGFTGVGYPKVVPEALADHVEKNNLQGKLRYELFCGASSGLVLEGRWAKLDMISRRACAVHGPDIAKAVNSAQVDFFDGHVSTFPQAIQKGYLTLDKPDGLLDVVIIEASAITEDGQIVLGPAVGATPELAKIARKIVVEINTTGPSYSGLHDIVDVKEPPNTQPLLVQRVDDRIGSPFLAVDHARVVAVIESDKKDTIQANKPVDDTSRAIAKNLIKFLKAEVKAGRLPKDLLPLQSGLGNVANAIIGGLAEDKDDFHNLEVWTEVLQDTFLDLMDAGTLKFASSCAIRFTPEGFKRLYDNWDHYKSKIMLRSQHIANHPEIIRRLGIIAMDTPVEVDLYGHANSSCVMGSRMIVGLGGSNDYLRNGLGIMHTPSVRPTKTDPAGISCIVPMVTHVDSTEHDLDVVVTEQGTADLRGKSPRQRARAIIDNCAHPDYKPILYKYLEKAEAECLKKGIGHESHLLFQVYDMYKNLQEHGTMKVKSW